MLTSLRTFRLTAALMAVLMLLSGSLPLVQHACAMALRHAATSEHPCAEHAPDAAPAHHGHGMHTQASMKTAPPCDHEAPRDATAHDATAHDEAAPRDCCTVEAAPAITANGIRVLERLPTTLVVFALAAAVPAPDRGVSPSLFYDTGPAPAASIARHLVYSVLLN